MLPQCQEISTFNYSMRRAISRWAEVCPNEPIRLFQLLFRSSEAGSGCGASQSRALTLLEVCCVPESWASISPPSLSDQTTILIYISLTLNSTAVRTAMAATIVPSARAFPPAPAPRISIDLAGQCRGACESAKIAIPRRKSAAFSPQWHILP